MNRITIELPVDVRNIVSQLNMREKIELSKILIGETRKSRWAGFFHSIDKKMRSASISEKEISDICKTARQNKHD